MEVWQSAPFRATKFFHHLCNFSYVGYPEVKSNGCVGLQLGSFDKNATWYLYTADPNTKEADGKFCCEATAQGSSGDRLGALNHKFMDHMKYIGVVDHESPFYRGKAKRYVNKMSTPRTFLCPSCVDEPTLPLDVWYETDMDDRPLRFGELGTDLVIDGHLHDEDLPLVYEDFDPSSFLDTAEQHFPDTVFKVPDVCESHFGCHVGREHMGR